MSKQDFYIIESSPHQISKRTTPQIMYGVVILTLPMCFAGIYFFGWGALSRILVSILACEATEFAFLKIRKKDLFAVIDGSSLLTGILLALTLPPNLPLYQVALGAVVSIALGKQVFGGLGFNIFNPALVGRAFLQAAYPVDMTTWVDPFMKVVDSISSATPLGGAKFGGESSAIENLFFGNTGGCIGETSALLILIMGIILLAMKFAEWRIPVSILTTVLIYAEFAYLIQPDKFQNPLYYLFSGGLLLGAFFMATDMVTSPITPVGKYIFGAGIGIMVMTIRLFGGLPEGMMFAILFMNSFVPLLNRYTRPLMFGEREK